MSRILATLIWCFFCNAVLADAFTLITPDELAMARNVSAALTDVVTKVSRCVDADKMPIDVCRCDHKESIGELSKIYTEASSAFPHWSDKTLNFPQSDSSNVNTALNFKMLPHAIAINCP